MTNEEFYKDAKGEDVVSLGWGSDYAQRKRFSVIVKYLSNYDSVLDVGCGYGDLLPWAPHKTYKGIDLRQEAIDIAIKKRPNERFVVGSVFNEVDCFDWVVASGIFCFDCDVDAHLKKMFELCNKGVIVNFLHGNQVLRSFTISEIEQFAVKLTNKFVIRHDYLPNDTTLILYK